VNQEFHARESHDLDGIRMEPASSSDRKLSRVIPLVYSAHAKR
jgi:hypothetical protein